MTTTEARTLAASAMTEQELLDAVIDLAGALGWRRYHQRPGRTPGGSWTRTTAGDSGFPDLVLVRERFLGPVLFVELKSGKGKLSEQQERWRDALLANGSRWLLWRPEHWLSGEIEAVLRGQR